MSRWSVKVRFLDGTEQEWPSARRPRVRRGVVRLFNMDGSELFIALTSVRLWYLWRLES